MVRFQRVLLGCMWMILPTPLVAQEQDLNTMLMRATVKINHEKSAATGFLLAGGEGDKTILVTAAHAFENTPGDETTLIFRKQESEGVYRKQTMKLIIRKSGKPCWTRHPSEDVGVMYIVPPKDADIAKVPVGLLATNALLKKHKVHPGERVAYVGYPHRIEANEAGFPILRDGPIASFPLLPAAKNKTFLMSANTFEGDSGSAVYLTRRSETGGEEVRLILGLVSAQQFLDEDIKMIYETSKVRHRMGLAVVVQATFIKETIERLP